MLQVRERRRTRSVQTARQARLAPTHRTRNLGDDVASVDDLRSALEARGHRIKKQGDGWQTTCPAHEDKEPSLRFGPGDRSELVATCHAGCTFGAIIAALDLDASNGPSDFESRIEATYDYVDEAGELLYQAVRLRSPKSFRQRLPDGSWKLGDVRRVLYRLPAVREAASSGRSVFVVEGEKDVEALEALGFVATCSPMGAGKWRDEYALSLHGVPQTIVVADCDGSEEKPKGRQHAAAVCASLFAHGVPCRLLDPAPDRDDGFDVSDLIAAHGPEAKTALEKLARKAPHWPLKPKATLPIVSWRDFSASVGEYDDRLDYLGAFLRGGQRVHVIGPIGHGKTTFLAEALSSAIHGREFLGFHGRDNIRGVYIDLEMPPELLKQTLTDARFDLDSDLFDLVHLPDGLEVDSNAQHREMIENAMGAYQVVAIDPWYKLIGDELSEGMRNVRTVISFLDGIRTRFPKTAVMIGFHANEPQKGQKIRGLGDASGYKAFQRPADTAVLFERIAGDRSHLTWAKTRSARLPKMGERWLLEWTRGDGFQRVERGKATDELLALLNDDWQDKHELADAWGRSASFSYQTALKLVYEGRAEKRSLGRMVQFRRADADQEKIDLGDV